MAKAKPKSKDDEDEKPPLDLSRPGLNIPQKHYNIELMTPEARKKHDIERFRSNPTGWTPSFQDEGDDPDYLARPGAANKYNKRDEDIELPHEGPTIKIEVSAPKRKRSVGNY